MGKDTDWKLVGMSEQWLSCSHHHMQPQRWVGIEGQAAKHGKGNFSPRSRINRAARARVCPCLRCRSASIGIDGSRPIFEAYVCWCRSKVHIPDRGFSYRTVCMRGRHDTEKEVLFADAAQRAGCAAAASMLPSHDDPGTVPASLPSHHGPPGGCFVQTLPADPDLIRELKSSDCVSHGKGSQKDFS